MTARSGSPVLVLQRVTVNVLGVAKKGVVLALKKDWIN